MANLGPLYQNATYSNLLQVDGGLTATLKPVLDGDGNASGLSLGLNSVSISGLVADSASNLYLGTAGAVPYQSAPSTTAFTAAGSAGQVLTSNGTSAPTWSTLTAAGIGALASDGSIPMTGQLSLGYNKIVQVGAPADDYDAANKGYVDSVATGLQVKTACRVATTANLSLTGAATVDGVAVATSDRVLVKNQTASAENGIYVANTSGAWTRATDANTWAELVGAAAFITAGSTQANTTWVSNIAVSGTLGTDPVTFVQFGASTAYTAGTGLTLTGSQFSLSSPVSIANGGTGQTTQANAINALLPSQTGYSGRFLSTDGTQAYWSVVSPYNPAAVAITGGTINGTTIGGSTPAAGTFTDLTASGTGTVDLKSFITVNATAAFLRNPRIWNPAETYWYRITPSPITQDVYATLPQLTGNDTFVFAGHAQTLTNKTLTSPTISGGSISGITDLAIADGGTGASDATTARSNLGLAIGTNVQAYNAGLADIAGLAKTDSNFIVGNGTNWVAESGATARTSLGLGNIATISTTGSTTNFLRADGAWAAPTSTSTGWTLSGSDTYTDNYILQGLTSKPSGAQYGDMAFQTAIWNGTSGMTGDRYSNLALCFSGNNYGASACGLTIFKTRGSTVASLVAAKYNTIENGWIGDDIGEIAMEGTDGQQYIKAGFITYAIDSAGKSGVGTADINVGQMPTRLAFATRDATITFPASSIVSGRAGQRFVIASTGTTNWTAIGAASTSVGTSFTYNGAAVTGTGTVYDVSSYSNQFGYGIIIDSKQNVYIAGSEHNAGNGKFAIGINGYVPTYEYTHLSRTVGIASVTYYNGSTGGGSVINTTNGFSSTTPVYGFWYDQNTGLGNPSASVATIICNTSEAARFTSSAITLAKPVTFSGSVSGTSATFNGTTTLRNDSLTTPDTGATTNVYRPTQGSVAQYYVGSTASGQLYISSGGTPAFYSGSDYRLKTNIADIQNAIGVVKQLKPCSFNVNDNPDTQYGFVAHELQQAWADAVIGEKDAVDADGNPIYQQVAYTKLVPVLTKCLVELIAKVEALEQANG